MSHATSPPRPPRHQGRSEPRPRPDPRGEVDSSAADLSRQQTPRRRRATTTTTTRARARRPAPAGPAGADAGVRMRAWIERLGPPSSCREGVPGRSPRRLPCPAHDRPPLLAVRAPLPAVAAPHRPLHHLDAAIETAAVWLFKVLVDEVLVPRDIRRPRLGRRAVRRGHGRGRRRQLRRRRALDLGQRALPARPARSRFYAHLQRLPLDFFEGRRLGDVLSRLTGDIQAIESFVLSGVADAL